MSAQWLGPPALEFSFSNPGARSLGFGGAFVALADDATAAFANPAGLLHLVHSEVSIEGRFWSYSLPFAEGGRLENAPSGFGIDTEPGLRQGLARSDLSDVSFLSFAYPRKRFTLAFYRHRLANFESATETQGLFFGGTISHQIRQFDQRTATDLEISNYGVAVAYRVSDAWSLGLALSFAEGRLASVSDFYGLDDDSVSAIFRLNSYLPARRILRVSMGFDDSDWTLTGGFLWNLSRHWTIGGFFREGASFDLASELTFGPLAYLGPEPGSVLELGSTPLSVPDVYGLGVAYRSGNGGFTVSFEWDRVSYSDLLAAANPDVVFGDDIRYAAGDEVRLGAEVAFLRSKPLLALRIGAWSDPAHRPRFVGENIVGRATFPGSDDELHFAAGIGLAFETFQVDIGIDRSALVDTAAVSMIYHF